MTTPCIVRLSRAKDWPGYDVFRTNPGPISGERGRLDRHPDGTLSLGHRETEEAARAWVQAEGWIEEEKQA